MNRKPIVPCLWLDDQAEPAASFCFGLSWQVAALQAAFDGI
jgi:hypothetical protein